MSSILNATDKSTTANAYCTEAYATTYLTQKRLPNYAPEWLVADVPTREAAIIWATRVLDECFNWNGWKRTLTQSLRWPRSGVTTPDFFWYDYDTVPDPIREGTAELALSLLKRDRTKEPKLLGQGFSDLAVGPIKLNVDPTMVLALIPTHIAAKLQYMGSVQGPGEGSAGSIKLLRS